MRIFGMQLPMMPVAERKEERPHGKKGNQNQPSAKKGERFIRRSL